MNRQQMLHFILIINLCMMSCTHSDTAQNTEEEVEQIEQLEEVVVNKEGVIDIEGYSIKYIRRGKGEPMVVIGSAQFYSKAFSKELEEQFEFIYVDSRHFVPNCPITEEELEYIDISTFSQDLETVRRELGLDKFNLIGHSVHGQIALDYAVKHPEQVSRLIIIGGVPYNFSELTSLQSELWETEASEERKSIMASNQEIAQKILDTTAAAQIFAVTYFYEAPIFWKDPKYDASPLLKGLKACKPLMDQLFAVVPSKEAVIQKLEKLSIPSIVILGKFDFVIPYTAWEEILEGKSQPTYVLMENAAHSPQTEKVSQEEFNQILLNWMAKN